MARPAPRRTGFGVPLVALIGTATFRMSYLCTEIDGHQINGGATILQTH
jgi:hypothetical protein